MQIESLKDLEKLVKLCRKLGIDKIEVDGVKFELGTNPTTYRRQANKNNSLIAEETFIPGGVDATTSIPDAIDTDSLTDEQLLYYSSTGGQQLGLGEQL